jgi:hypothetical protein
MQIFHENRRSTRILLNIRLVVSINACEAGETAQSWIVNAHGGLIVGSTIANAHEIIVMNPRTQMSRRCKVVRVESLQDGRFLIAFEFYQPSPEFWGVESPPSDWCVSK